MTSINRRNTTDTNPNRAQLINHALFCMWGNYVEKLSRGADFIFPGYPGGTDSEVYTAKTIFGQRG
jgi:hypothetical protein